MFLHIVSDGGGGFYAYPVHSVVGDELEDILSGPIAIIALLAGPLFMAFNYGQQLLLPTALILLGFLMIYSPQSYEISQNPLLVYTKAALSVPLFYYSVACMAVVLHRAGEHVQGTDGMMMLLFFIVMFIPILGLVALTNGIATPMLILWPVAYATAGGSPKTTLTILHIAYLEIGGIFIYGVVKAIKERGQGKFYLLTKALAFGLGCLPLAAAAVLSSLPAGLTAAMTIVMYLALYLAYVYAWKQPSVFADFLVYPFLLSLIGRLILQADYSYMFPSEIMNSIRSFLQPLAFLLEPAHTLCVVFGEAISGFAHMMVSLFCALIPELDAPGAFPAFPPLVGAIGLVGLLALISWPVGTIADKIRRRKA